MYCSKCRATCAYVSITSVIHRSGNKHESSRRLLISPRIPFFCIVKVRPAEVTWVKSFKGIVVVLYIHPLSGI
jgi:hypothetical protein